MCQKNWDGSNVSSGSKAAPEVKCPICFTVKSEEDKQGNKCTQCRTNSSTNAAAIANRERIKYNSMQIATATLPKEKVTQVNDQIRQDSKDMQEKGATGDLDKRWKAMVKELSELTGQQKAHGQFKERV